MSAEIRDWAGVGHAVAREPRIACLVPSVTETLFALGLGDRVVARTGFCIHPRETVRRVPRVGGTKDPDLAKLRALAPTHLVVNVDENRREDVDAAREFIASVVVTHPMGPADNPRLFALLGAIFDRRDDAAKLASDARASLDALQARASTLSRERVLYLIWRKPWMTVSRDTYVSRTLGAAGFDTLPVEAGVRYPQVDDADRVLLSTEPYAFRERDAAALREGLRKPVDLIDGEWTSWYGVRAIAGLRGLGNYRAATPGSGGKA